MSTHRQCGIGHALPMDVSPTQHRDLVRETVRRVYNVADVLERGASVNPPVLREPPVKLGVPLAAPVVIEPDAEFDPEAETQFRDLAYARRPPCPAASRAAGGS